MQHVPIVRKHKKITGQNRQTKPQPRNRRPKPTKLTAKKIAYKNNGRPKLTTKKQRKVQKKVQENIERRSKSLELSPTIATANVIRSPDLETPDPAPPKSKNRAWSPISERKGSSTTGSLRTPKKCSHIEDRRIGRKVG